MSAPISVFVSSGCYELRDIRVAIRDLLKSFGITPMLSEDPGFPSESGVEPYVTCLDTLIDCPLVVGVLEREYGRKFSDWGKHSKYNDLSPTHAEFRHAADNGKKLLIYVHRDTLKDYDTWRNNKDEFAKVRNKNSAEIDTLELLHEMKHRKPAPWIIPFKDASEIVASLKERLIGEIFVSLKEQEQQNLDSAGYFVQQFLAQTPEARHQIEGMISPDLVSEIEQLRNERAELEQTGKTSAEALAESTQRLDEVNQQLASLEATFKTQETLLALAAARDASWLHIVRTRYMPKQPGRVPFHNADEVALRGFQVGPRKQPALESVTWSALPYTENGLHRGYKAGLIFRGKDFSPGVTIGLRYPRDNQLKDHIHWHTPNIYFGDYMEISTNEDVLESPLGYRDAEFCVKNPLGQESPWVGFSYAFDDELLTKVMRDSATEGRALIAQKQPGDAVEKLRKAMVFAKKLLGPEADETVSITKEWNDALDAAARARLRFGIGDKVRVIEGELSGHEGTITEVALRHLHAYTVTGIEMRLRDDQLEAVS